MTPIRRRSRSARLVPSVALAVLAAAGCSAGGGRPSVTVPTPSSEAAAYCEALHKELPKTVDDLERTDPEPDSALTAGWGDGAIVLRCGVPRPAKMDDAQSKGIDADGVNWLLEQPDDAGPRFTTTYRKAYVEVTLGTEYAHDITPLSAFAGPVARTVPESL
ncbi:MULTISPECIES: DUF3515 domain-containing protein [Streptomyces]|uniref:DUF3515 domain-containing protein n=2 Tax=Streptomyces TaxID=1883 RepID=A0ABU2RIR5_9ACTN|nr:MULTISPECIES: DUF3515 domain-containing protein [unclassified Streptomyces]MBK3593531.1 DUF3515 domain-containing protein [Streptomyces sp. MBT51]MDT0428753.1 DUF3515 domain-containing protein [Streptomyces sp. DSM 41770]HBF83919.1 DUF3515 domain-containing protein [Streptomyces sp.]